MKDGRFAATLGSMLSSILVVGCAPHPLAIPPHADLVPCPVKTYIVEELSRMGEPGCDLEGSTVVVPDGTSVAVSGIGHVKKTGSFGQSGQSGEVHVVNWGTPGVGVTAISGDGKEEIWASTDEALQLQRKL